MRTEISFRGSQERLLEGDWKERLEVGEEESRVCAAGKTRGDLFVARAEERQLRMEERRRCLAEIQKRVKQTAEVPPCFVLNLCNDPLRIRHKHSR